MGSLWWMDTLRRTLPVSNSQPPHRREWEWELGLIWHSGTHHPTQDTASRHHPGRGPPSQPSPVAVVLRKMTAAHPPVRFGSL